MSDEPKKRARWWISWLAVSLLIAYPFSLGPACLIYSHHPDERIVDPFNAVYAPLFWCCDKSDLFAEALFWYVHLWVAPT
jgi:hypothetical protein